MNVYVVILFSVFMAEPSFGPKESEYLHSALKMMNMSELDLSFEKKWKEDSIFRLNVVDDLLNNPLRCPRYIDSCVALVESLRTDMPSLLLFEAEQIDVKISPKEVSKIRNRIKVGNPYGSLLKEDIRKLPEDISLSLSYILTSFDVADEYLKKATEYLTEEEIDKILLIAPVLWGDEDDSTDNWLKGELHREFGAEVDTSMEVDNDTILEYAKRVDRRSLALSGISVSLGVQLAKECLESGLNEMNGVWVCDTKWGKVAVGGCGDDVYEDNYSIIIDFGGNDVYNKRVGGGVGILSFPFSVVIDFDGDDLYRSDKIFNFGSSIFGVGILIDEKGDDIYKSSHYSLGSTLFGTGVLIDGDGNDFYSGGYFIQGSANFGLAMLLDREGDDTYKSFNYAQGMGATFGYGLLCDFGGNDSYYAGGRYTHDPLLPEDYRSFAQGFGIGARPDGGGGIGFLYDRDGNDFYNAEVYGQGTSYWYSFGALYDGGGNDYYNAAEYAQGAGIHLSVGILIDRSGNDHYFSRFGPSQGEGHDLSVGWLIDKSGDDSYCVSGGQGIGLTNSCGIFIDSQGDDIYITSETLGQGDGNWKRHFGGIGIFLDLGGEDTYGKRSPAENSGVWTQGTFGVGIDLKTEEIEDIVEGDTTVGITVREIFETASLWEVGENRKKVRIARERLKELGMVAVRYIFNEKIDTESGLELRAIKELAKSLPDSMSPYLLRTLRDERKEARANAIWLLGEIEQKDATDSLICALERKENESLKRTIILALGKIGNRAAVPKIIPYLKDKVERNRVAACEALGRIKDEQAIPYLIDGLKDSYFSVRAAAEWAIVEFSAQSLSNLLNALEKKNVKSKPHLLSALGRIGEKLKDARVERIRIKKAILPFLDSEDNLLRGYAVEALGRLGTEEIRAMLRTRMADEIDEFVLGKYRIVLE